MSLSNVSLMNINPYYRCGSFANDSMGISGLGFGDYGLFYNPEYLIRQDDYRRVGDNLAIAHNAEDKQLLNTIKNFKNFIRDDRTDKAIEQYDILLKQMIAQKKFDKQIYDEDGKVNDSRLRALANNYIEQSLQNEDQEYLDIKSFIEKYASGSFVRGLTFREDLPTTTANDVIEATTGAPVGSGLDPVKRGVGNGITLGAAAGTTLALGCGAVAAITEGTAIGTILLATGKGALCGGLIGAGIGLAAGTVWALGSWLFGGSKPENQPAPATNQDINVDAISGASPHIQETPQKQTPAPAQTPQQILPSGHGQNSSWMNRGFAY